MRSRVLESSLRLKNHARSIPPVICDIRITRGYLLRRKPLGANGARAMLFLMNL